MSFPYVGLGVCYVDAGAASPPLTTSAKAAFITRVNHTLTDCENYDNRLAAGERGEYPGRGRFGGRHNLRGRNFDPAWARLTPQEKAAALSRENQSLTDSEKTAAAIELADSEPGLPGALAGDIGPLQAHVDGDLRGDVRSDVRGESYRGALRGERLGKRTKNAEGRECYETCTVNLRILSDDDFMPERVQNVPFSEELASGCWSYAPTSEPKAHHVEIAERDKAAKERAKAVEARRVAATSDPVPTPDNFGTEKERDRTERLERERAEAHKASPSVIHDRTKR